MVYHLWRTTKMKDYNASELGLIVESLKHFQLKKGTDIILYQELEYVIYKTNQKIKILTKKDI